MARNQCSCLNVGYKSAWYLPNSEELLSLLLPGDLIEFRRGVYHHWAIFADDWFSSSDNNEAQVFHAGSATHVNSGNLFFGSMSMDKGKHGVGAVSVDPLNHVWKNSEARINNDLDLIYPPFTSSETLIRAEIRVFDQRDYNLITNNCEHFATWCRNGATISRQAEVTLKTGFTTVCTYACMAMAGAIFMMLKFKTEFEDEFIMSDSSVEKAEIELDEKEEDEKEKEKKERKLSLALD